MSQDFTTRLQLQLRAAALREERRSAPQRWLAGARHGMPAPGAAAAVALAALLVAVVVAVGGLRWGGEDDAVSNPKVIGTVSLAENLGTISSGFGSVWVSDIDRQVLLRVDPRTRRVQAEIRTGGDSNALGGDPIAAAGRDAVWAIARSPGTDGGHRILRIDPETDRITARAALPDEQAPLVFDLQIVDGRPWVLTPRGAIEIDPATGRPGRFVAIDPKADEDFPQWTIIADGQLWVLTRSQRIDRYDLGTGEKGASLPVRLPGVFAAVPTPEGLFLSGPDGELARVDETDGRVAWRRQVGNTSTLPLILEDRIWVHSSDVAGGRDRLVELDPRTGRVLSATGLPEFGIAWMTPVGSDLWITTPGGKVMIVRP
jgi:outer membrane protein assembly factor BamB